MIISASAMAFSPPIHVLYIVSKIMVDFDLDMIIISEMAVKPNTPQSVSYEYTYKAAITELSQLMSEREDLDSKRAVVDNRIAKLRSAIVGLGGLCDKSMYVIASEHPELFPDTATPDVGFTDAIREVFRTYKDYYFSPVEIRDELEENGFDIKKYKNVLASIHSILKRLKSKAEIIDGTKEDKVVYKCNPRGPLAQDPEPANDEPSDDDIPF